MSTHLDERLMKAHARCKAAWWITMIICAAYVWGNMSPWALLLLIPFGFILYLLFLYITVVILAFTIPQAEILQADVDNEAAKAKAEKIAALAEISARQQAGEVVETDEILEALNAAGVVDIVKVTDTGPVIGHYKDKEIYSHIMVKVPNSGDEDQMMVYHGPANIVDGTPEIPVIDGMIFACVENILYSKEVPAESK